MMAPVSVRRPDLRAHALLGLLLVAVLPLSVAAQNQSNGSWADEIITRTTFAQPPQEIVEAVLAPRYLNVTLSNESADGQWFLDEISDGPVTMDVFSRPFHELGGQFIDFAANRHRNLTIRNNVGIRVISAADGSERQIEIPDGARVSGASWSPDGSRIGYLAHFDNGTHVYVADPTNGRSRQVTRSPLLATFVTDFEWIGDGEAIAVVLPPENRTAMPSRPAVPPGPQIKVAEESDRNMLRTYASLMATPYDEELLKWHTTGQLAVIEVGNRRVTRIGQPAMIRSIDPSPDGMYFRVTRMVEPFSYVVPVTSFGTIEEVWDRSGTVLTTLNERELQLGVRDDDAPTAPGVGGGRGGGANDSGKRELSWRADGQGFTYLEQEAAPESEETGDTQPQRGGGAQAGQAAGGRGGQGDARRPDRVMQWLPPFDSTSSVVVYEQNTRMQGHRFSEDMSMLFFTERSGQNVTEFAVRLEDPESKHQLVRYSTSDFYDSPGSLVSSGGGGGGRFGGFGGRGGGGGGAVMVSGDGAHVFYQGTVYDENPTDVGPKTFIDRVAIESGDKERIYESDNNGVFERISSILDIDAGRFIVTRESPTDVPQSYLLENGQRTQLTRNVDYTPDITSARKERFVVTRPDGFKFRVTVNLPPDYVEGTRLPAMFWFYPREYTDQESYDRGARTFNRNAFTNFGTRSMEFLVRLGYAVVEPDAPIVGEQGAMNNNYENDLRNNLAAVIDEVDRRGWVDRQRIGIGGHSYGAFSTVNAMVHTPFFKAGIAGDGNYNRTLTPLQFQSERRILWDARDVYLGMSPFLYANNLTGALLMYHGMHDQNVGTDPTHSPRLFHALNGLGKTVSMYLYPFEDHGPATLETQLDLWARWTAWLDKYVKNAGQQATVTTTTDGS
jgi:dipeptidyl aminopeptidase/acylaminoacyl peptidase